MALSVKPIVTTGKTDIVVWLQNFWGSFPSNEPATFSGSFFLLFASGDVFFLSDIVFSLTQKLFWYFVFYDYKDVLNNKLFPKGSNWFCS